MKMTLCSLIIISLVFLISACGQEANNPSDIYIKYTQALNGMNSFSDDSINQYLTKRAVAKKGKGINALKTLPEAQRKGLEVMALNMFKSSSDWLDLGAAKLDLQDAKANLKTEVVAGSETTTTQVNFVKENGWKIDTISKSSNDSKTKTKMSEALFE